MDEELLRADPAKIGTTLKEGIVDALLNVTYSRISGHGAEGEVLFGARPRAVLSSAFLLPRLLQNESGDEVTQPIRITAHGLDLQILRNVAGKVEVKPSLQVYARVLPTSEDLNRPDCKITFRLRDEVRRTLRDEIETASKERWATLSAGKSFKERHQHPNWKQIDKEIRGEVGRRLGLPPNIKTLFATEDDAPLEAGGEGASEGVSADSKPLPQVNDSLFRPMDMPHKWRRIPLDQDSLPRLLIDPGLPKADIEKQVSDASEELNRVVREAIRRWADSEDGNNWCYRKDVSVLPSQYQGWQQFLDVIRADRSRNLALPSIDLRWDVRLVHDWTNRERSNLHISLENVSEEPKRGADLADQSVFQVHLDVRLPNALHAPLKLGRVEASYRYNEHLDYPALGFNGGVHQVRSADATELHLQTTWCPRYVQPRMVPKSYEGIKPNLRLLSRPEGLSSILGLSDALDEWFRSLDDRVNISAGLSADDLAGRDRERAGFLKDKEGWKKEIEAVKAGLEILRESEKAWGVTCRRGPQEDGRAAVFEAWLAMNETMADLMKDRTKDDKGAWRLFQIAFVIAHIPAMASRMPEFRDKYIRERDDTVTLLYFATGGGKSEAFFGLLVFTLFLDRLRGKTFGITAMLRYPLRLLTIQQAQRCAKVLAKAELIRKRLKIDGSPFAIGFWVGGGGSPNSHYTQGVSDIPEIKDKPADLETEKRLLSTQINYEIQKAAWNKIPACPFCGEETVLRRFSDLGGTLAHVCSRLACESNAGVYSPLPFYICDADIYDLAPPVLLGTVDKLALIGQSTGTLRRIYAMLGAAPWFNPATNRLHIPNSPADFDGGPEQKNYQGLFPAYPNGRRLFHDPFPSLLIQDEAHLLDESLGTFAGLFESALDAILDDISKPLYELVAFEPGGNRRRRAKVIAASATVSDPDRQLVHLYQRPVPAMQFPYPGEKLYRSFYAEPSEPDEPERKAISGVESRSKWARVYAGFMTNGRAHTTTTVAVLSNYHTVITELLQELSSGDDGQVERVRSLLMGAITPSETAELRRAKIASASASEIATLVDLHRIALTYVTNKKGGDQIMAAEFEETRKRHQERNLAIKDLRTELITGSVSQGEIQRTVHDAQSRPSPGLPLEDLDASLRSVIATSAVSHGVDVEEFNAMFFAGMPSDIAEYIQASSRVGRTHVGFVVLIPTPQRRRDRYIVEVFDSYHRFLERMVSPAAIDRWAGRAIERVLPSFIQAQLAGVAYVQGILNSPPEEKHRVPNFDWIPFVVEKYKGPATKGPLVRSICDFVERAVGLDNEDYAPGGKQHYQELIRDRVHSMLDGWANHLLGAQYTLTDFFKSQASVMKKPMTSLRDVDETGQISFGHIDLGGGRRVDDSTVKPVMKLIRRGVVDSGD